MIATQHDDTDWAAALEQAELSYDLSVQCRKRSAHAINGIKATTNVSLGEQ